MKNSASRINTLKAFNIHPDYYEIIKKEISQEIYKELNNYVNTIDLLYNHILQNKIDKNDIPDISYIEEHLLVKSNLSDEEIKIGRLLESISDNILSKDILAGPTAIEYTNYRVEEIDNLLDTRENQIELNEKYQIEFDSIENFIADLEEREAQTKMEYEEKAILISTASSGEQEDTESN